MTGTDPSALLLRVLRGETTSRPPLWLMRQAGRYLPEYRELRARAGGFLDLCYTPAFASEATLQPIRRFGFDAAILFSDILVVPDALGQEVGFVEGEGPRLAPVADKAALAQLRPEINMAHLAPVFETVGRVRAALPGDTPLIGFCGAPWTVASYMIAGKGTPDQAPARILAYRDPDFLDALVDRLIEASSAYLIAQIDAGVDVVQIFESFAGALPPPLFRRWSLEPIGRLVGVVRAARPRTPVIVFARGAGFNLAELSRSGIADAVGLDWSVEAAWAREYVQTFRPVQGNLDPLALIAGGDALERAIDDILAAFASGPHIFNLGHGILPETPIAHVERLVERVKGAGRQ